MANSADPDQTASILNSLVILGKYLQQITFSDAFFLGALRVKVLSFFQISAIALNSSRQ